ncbi:MAG: DUF4281 domain-containing protein [Gemmatimonadaceae bacterium]|nr:DUF4281 domain-containing protein [Gemmatimonadaceae bacterium]
MPPADTLFAIANPLPLPAWLLLLFLPRWKYTLPIARLVLVPLLSLAYAAIILLKFGEADGDFNSLAGVQQLFANPYALLGGWIHYLAFDLFVGTWIVEDALARQVPWWARAIPLPLTLMFGPVGLLLYLVLRQLSAASVQPPARTGSPALVGST